MSKTRIFVSSTCYDLSAVREALREEVIAIGHEPVLSEYSSFPVLPEPGDALAIKRSVDKLIEGCDELLDWETDILFTSVPERLERMKTLMHGTTKGLIDELSRLPDELGRPFKGPTEPKGKITIQLTVPESPNIKLFCEEAACMTTEMQRRPWKWAE